MTPPEFSRPSRALQLRQDFDRRFAAPPPAEPPAQERLLLVSAGPLACAVPLVECAAVLNAPMVTGLPAAEPGFVGLGSVGGAVLPVYDLVAAVESRAREAQRRRWLLVTAGSPRAAFLVDRIDGYATRDEDAAAADVYVPTDGAPRRIISLARLVEALSERTRPAGATRSVR